MEGPCCEVEIDIDPKTGIGGRLGHYIFNIIDKHGIKITWNVNLLVISICKSCHCPWNPLD